MKLQKLFFPFFLLMLLLVSCHFNMDEKKKEGNETEISVIRFDKLLNEYVELNSFSALQKMNTEYAVETKLLIEDILGLGQVNDNNINGRLKAYFSDPTLQALMKDALVKYDDMEEVEKGLTYGFKKLKEEVPSIKIPSVYAQFSALNESVVVGDSILGFSVDKYMGEDYPLYKRYYYDYQRKSMNPNRIIPDCFSFYLMSEYPFPMDGNRTLLDMMMHFGKINYVVSKIMGYKSFEEELGFTKEEIEWCKANKKSIWMYMVQNGHLFATDPMIIRKYTKPAPYTAFFGDDSPAMVGIWMGVQLIDSYMKNNKKTGIKELLENTDYQQMLTDTKFKP